MGLSGTCMCGAIGYESSSDAEFSALCHCVDCQKWSGSAFTSNVIVPEDSFKLVKGKTKFYDVTGASGKINRHFFCNNCGSSMYTKLDIMPGKLVIKAGGLDNGAAGLDNKVAVELYCKNRVPYLKAAEGAKQEQTM